MDEDEPLMLTTMKCKNCGKTWVVPDEIGSGAEADGPSKRTDEGFIVCANCGVRNTVWEMGIRKIERRQG